MLAGRHSTVLVIDDSPESLTVLSTLLRAEYRVLVAASGEDGLRLAHGSPTPDLILLDVVMPGLDGYDVLALLRAARDTADIPVIFLTSLGSAVDEELGLRLGASDYLAKPPRLAVVLARVRTHLEAKQARDWLRDQNSVLEAEVNRRMAENDLTQRVTIRALANLAETRDPETGNHILRTQDFVRLLANELRSHPRFAATLTERYVDLVTRSAPLHDIGKVGIPDHVLLKPGKLTPEEWTIMKTHARLGSEALERAEHDVEVPLEFLSLAKEIAHWHHEKWDGSGYPDALVGDAIPVSARLMAVADVFDALTNRRVYKPAMSYTQALELIVAGRGQHFDPDVTAAFVARFEDFVRTAEHLRDSTPPPAGAPSTWGGQTAS